MPPSPSLVCKCFWNLSQAQGKVCNAYGRKKAIVFFFPPSIKIKQYWTFFCYQFLKSTVTKGRAESVDGMDFRSRTHTLAPEAVACGVWVNFAPQGCISRWRSCIKNHFHLWSYASSPWFDSNCLDGRWCLCAQSHLWDLSEMHLILLWFYSCLHLNLKNKGIPVIKPVFRAY